MLGVPNAARRRPELAVQVSDDLLVVCVRPAVVVSGTRVVIGDDLRVVCIHLAVVVGDDLRVVRIYLAVIVIDGLLVGSVDSVNFEFELLLRPTLRFAHLAVELVDIECCHDPAPIENLGSTVLHL